MLLHLKKIAFIISLQFVAQGCMLTSKMDKIVSGYYANKSSLNSLNNKNNFLINTDSLKRLNGFCKSEYKSFYTVPLLVYTYSNEKIKCTVNTKFYVNAFVNELNKLLDLEYNKQKLDNKTIELFFTRIPNSFTHSYYSHTIIIQFLFGNGITLAFREDEMYYPQNKITLNYVIRDKSTSGVLKQGNFSELVNKAYSKKGYYEGRRYFVEDFVQAYDNTMQYNCTLIAQKLVDEL